jgi:SAM-dependent methyltransferase
MQQLNAAPLQSIRRHLNYGPLLNARLRGCFNRGRTSYPGVTMRSPSPTLPATDWDRYYTSVPVTAKLTRRYTSSVLASVLARYGVPEPSILEIGGANSCFLPRLMRSTPPPRSYDVVDSNQYGLSLLSERAQHDPRIHLHQQSIFNLRVHSPYDIVFSVGLVEHFDQELTRKAILAHFDVVRPGGLVVITFPTPTLLYRVVRSMLEKTGAWKFPDERPLRPEEVKSTASMRGKVLYEKTLWPLILTQHLIAVRALE